MIFKPLFKPLFRAVSSLLVPLEAAYTKVNLSVSTIEIHVTVSMAHDPRSATSLLDVEPV